VFSFNLEYRSKQKVKPVSYLPITLELNEKRSVIVGGGEVALRKLKTLLKATDRIDVISREFDPELLELVENHHSKKVQKVESINLIKAEFTPLQLETYDLVIAATNNALVNRAVSTHAKRLNLLVNVVDSLEMSNFILPAIIDRSPLLIAVSTSGISPVLARKLREKIEWLIPKNIGRLLNNLKNLRKTFKQSSLNLLQKKAFFEWFIEQNIDRPESNKNQLNFDSQEIYQQYLAQTQATSEKLQGKVFLVGAGPGDPDLLTIKALKLLQKADIVLYDALVTPEVLDLVRRDAKLVHVGKRSNKHFVKQETTNQLLIKYAQQGLNVIRLKGGDPFIFGRGGEELEALADHNIVFEVIPGITAASGCASYAGIPLTHRDYAQSVHFVTGHHQNKHQKTQQTDWLSLAKSNQTLVFYMGLIRNKTISESLIEHGLSQSTSVAIVENGTSQKQRVITGQLSELSKLVNLNQINTPALIIIGEVVSLSQKLAWFNQPIKTQEYQQNFAAGV